MFAGWIADDQLPRRIVVPNPIIISEYTAIRIDNYLFVVVVQEVAQLMLSRRITMVNV